MHGLPDCRKILEKLQSKKSRKATVGKAISRYWSERLQTVAPLYPIPKWLASDSTQIAGRHPLAESTGSLR